MKANIKIASYEYSGTSYGEAYLKGCKSLSKILQHEQITMNVEKADEERHMVIFNIYANVDMNESQREFCKICKEFHCSFFINEEYNCARCNLKAYLKRLKEKANVSKGYFKSQIEK